jgi:phosphosulfolactate phosphohydrolase-like enzyme
MTVEEVKARVADIAECTDDGEKAHSLEDNLYAEVLMHLAEQGNELAREAIKALELDFSRWCA